MTDRFRDGRVPLRVTYDGEADGSYIYLTDIGPGEAVLQHLSDEPALHGSVILDVSAAGRLPGIEVPGAASTPPPELLAGAERLDAPDAPPGALHRWCLAKVGTLLLGQAREAASTTGPGDFRDGLLTACRRALALVQSQAESFGIPPAEVGLEGVNPERDLR